MIERFIGTKSKTFVVFLFSMISLGIFTFSTQLAVFICSTWIGLIIGILLMLLAIPMHVAAKKFSFLYVFSFLLNFIACGFSVSAYYIKRNISPALFEIILALIPAALILSLIYIMLKIFSKTKKLTLTLALIINVLLLILSVIFWIRTGQVIFSSCFFCLVISLFFICIFGVTINHIERPVLRDISYGSFGTFVILTVVIIFILSEGDILDLSGIELGGGNGGGKKKVKK